MYLKNINVFKNVLKKNYLFVLKLDKIKYCLENCLYLFFF